MAKYQKGDCRNNRKRIENIKAYSRMRWIDIPRGENRRERRAIGARFRHAYGKAAYAEMMLNAKINGLFAAIATYLNGDKDRFEEITGHKLR